MSDKEKDLEKVTKMLERGGTMLAKHCDCGAPLFKYQGKVVCAVCDSKKEESRLAVPVETRPAVSPQAMEPVRKNQLPQVQSKQVSMVVGESGLNEPAIEGVVISKINEISSRMATETYPERIKMYMEILETSLRVLRELRSVSR